MTLVHRTPAWDLRCKSDLWRATWSETPKQKGTKWHQVAIALHQGGNLWKTLFKTFSVACSFFRWRHQGTSKGTWKCSFWERHQLGTHCILSSQIVTCHSEVPKQSTIYRFINTVHVALSLPSCITSKSQFEVKRFLLGWCRFSIFSSSSLAGGLVPQREMVSTLFHFNFQKFGFIIFFHPCWFPNFCTISLFTPVTLP